MKTAIVINTNTPSCLTNSWLRNDIGVIKMLITMTKPLSLYEGNIL